MSFAEIFIVPGAMDYQNSPFEPIFDGVPPADGGFGNSDRPQFPFGSSNDVQNVDECLLVELDNDNLEGLLSLVPTEDAGDDEQAQTKALLYSEPIPPGDDYPPIIVTADDPWVTSIPGEDLWMYPELFDNYWPTMGDYGDGGGENDSSDEECPCAPSAEDAANNEAVQDALDTANADMSGVERAIAAWEIIVDAANAAGIDPALLGAIALRESNFQNIDQIGGGMGRGVFQIDLGAHPNVTEAQANNIVFAANFAANLLAGNMAYLAAEFPNFTETELLQATAASYNFGTDDISGNPDTIDAGTTGDNYGSNVVDLMEAFKDPETGETPGADSDDGGDEDGCAC